MSSSLRLDWCSYEAAKYAVEHWHYSKRMPRSKLARLGVWEDDRFIGAVIFGVGAQGKLWDRYGLRAEQGCELVRVALTDHKAPVTRIVSLAIRLLRRDMPGLRLIVSFADPEQGHVGAIYQAGNWIYTGRTGNSAVFLMNGRKVHARTMSLLVRAGKVARRRDVPSVPGSSKHRYFMPLDDEMRARIAPLAKPYPRASRLESEAPGVQPGDEGAAMRPTRSNPWGITDG